MAHTDMGRKLVRASREELFDALVSEEARTVWLPPTGMTGRFTWFDARPGGGYRLTLTYDDESTQGKSAANTDVVDVRFVGMERPSRLVEEADFVSDDPALNGTMTMTWTFEPTHAGTLVTIEAGGVPDGISSEDHAAAFASTLDNLDRYVTRSPA